MPGIRRPVKGLSQWLVLTMGISLPLVQSQVITIPFQTFKEGINSNNDTTISPLRVGINNLEKLTTSIYPLELPAGSNSPTSVAKTLSTKLWALEHGVDQVSDELHDSTGGDGADFDALENILERIREKFMAYSTTTILVPEGFYTFPDQHEAKTVDIWTFTNELSTQLALNGGLDSPEASAGRLLSFFFSAPLPDSGTIQLDFDAFEIRLRTLKRLSDALGDIIDAPTEDIESFVTMVNDYQLDNAFELEVYLNAGYEDVQAMLKAYLDAINVISWKSDDLYWSLRGSWLEES
ncbi:hypothetical protein TWF730_007464 [Orbilia blumenaviensis]|uniref:Uncharacterized protein n=1 Tax=Orbilia blumenaviensis TaxID=1796055 RepID=A0AAV9VAL0_9PEZI